MIASLRGEIIAIEPEGLIVEVNQVGYQVYCPLLMMQGQYALNEDIFLFTHLIVREEQWTLFGFLSQEELALFKYFLGVSGIGGKSALGILNQLAPTQIVKAMQAGESRLFEKVSGIGKKTAQRLVLELKDKIAALSVEDENLPEEFPQAMPGVDHDAIAALCQLGYSRGEAKKAVLQVLGKEPGLENEQLLRQALHTLGKY